MKATELYESINKVRYIYTVEYDLAVKRDEVLIHATAGMNFKNITRSKRNQSRKTVYCMIPFVENVQNRQIHRVEVDYCLPAAGGFGGWGVTAQGVLFGVMN